MKTYLPPIGLMLLGVALLVVACMVGCTPANTRPDLPEATLAEHVETTRQVYVGIDPALTAHPEKLEKCSKFSDGVECAERRGGLVLQCWTNLDEIGRIQGTPVKPEGKKP